MAGLWTQYMITNHSLSCVKSYLLRLKPVVGGGGAEILQVDLQLATGTHF